MTDEEKIERLIKSAYSGLHPSHAVEEELREHMSAERARPSSSRPVWFLLPAAVALAIGAMLVADRPRSDSAELTEEDSAGALVLSEGEEKKRVAELIRRLPEVRGGPGGNGGWPDVFALPGAPSVAKQLADLGHAAVPALIDLLGDARETRAEYYPGIGVRGGRDRLRVGQVALLILERIAGRSFWPPGLKVPGEGGFGSSSLPNAKRWWKSIQEKGEKALLVEEVRARDLQLLALAARLAKRYPDAALEPIVHAARRVKSYMERAVLIRLAADLAGEAPVAFLREEMRDAPHLVQRVTAAFGLRQRGKGGTVEAMIAEWKGLADYGNPGRAGAIQDPINRSIQQLVVFLVTTGRAEAIRALGKGLADRPVNVRGLVMRALGTGALFHVYGHPGPWENRDPKARVDGPATEAALRSMLGDTAKDLTRFAGYKAKGWRIADQAARSLAQRFPDRYEFDIKASLPERDRMLREMIER